MSLSYFTIFNPSLGPDEDTLPNQLLFYTSSIVSDLDSQLRNIGLVQGIIELGRSFSGVHSVNFIKSKDTRSYLLELEEGFWSVLCLDVVTDDGIFDQQIPATNQVLGQMRNAYRLFKLEHGSLNSLTAAGREEAIKVIEPWWMRWSWSWNTHCASANILFEGFNQTRMRIANAQIKEMEDFRLRLTELFPECFHEILVMYHNEYISSGKQLSSQIKQILQVFLQRSQLEASRQFANGQGQRNERNRTPEHANEANVDKSWLNGKRWADETTRLFDTLIFRKVADAAAQPAVEIEPVQDYIWAFDEDKLLFFDREESDTHDSRYINVLCYKEIRFILILKIPGRRERALVKEHVETNVSHIAVSLAQAVDSSHPTAPIFFSLIYHQVVGSIVSTLPQIESAYEVSEADTPLQLTVKNNTIHLHRQIFDLMSRPIRQSCIKTSKNIWLLVKQDELGTVILAKSSKFGETMEEVEREGTRWMTKLRKNTN